MYAELLCRTQFSFLRGASQPCELVERAEELKLKALGVCDRNGVYGIPKAYHAAKDKNVKLIVGAELTLGNDLPLLNLLAMNRAGYGLMCRLLTASHAGKPKGEASLPWSEFLDLTRTQAAEGLIALPAPGTDSQSFLENLKSIFPGRTYLPVHRALDGKDKARTKKALELSRKLEIPLVATNDAHFHIPGRRALQDVLTAIREITPLSELGYRLFPNGERYLKSPEQMEKLFKDLPEALKNTLEVAEKCTFSPSELRYRYPSEWIPPGQTAQRYLERLTWEGARWRYPGGIPKDTQAQLEHELRLIDELKFADYFLTIWEIVDYARKNDILCQGRGSAANSAVCYCLSITAVDPVKMKLLFERFISAERGEPPDIDVDFEHERREEVIQHIYEKYGRDRAGMVAAIITYRDRSAQREVIKAFGGKDSPLAQKLTEEIQGFPRHLSIHSGGFTLSADPIIETVPIEPARMEGRTIVQWDKEDLACIGLLKVDILALGMLTAIQKTFQTLPAVRRMTLAQIPADDAETYAMIQKADTVGTFQIESRAQMSMLGRLLPKNFYDLVIQVAIVRPGPIVGQMVHPYLKRRRGLEDPKSPHPKLDEILERTLGVPLFQEQVMKIAITLADFTPGEADELRRAIGAWRSSGSIEKMGQKLMRGLLASGLPQDYVDRIFKQIQGFSEYGFPESHSASFALIAYASAYLKCHFPAEFSAALINSQPMGFYSSHSIIDDVKRHGVRVLPVDPAVSEWDCTLEGPDRALRVGLRVVQGLSKNDARKIIAERGQRAFTNLQDFLARVRLGPDVLHRLAMGEAFACFGISQRESLWEILAGREIFRTEGSQLSLFSQPEFAASEPHTPAFQQLSAYQTIRADYDVYGLSVRGHPMKALRRSIEPKFSSTTTESVRRARAGAHVRLTGLIIVRQRPPTAKGTAFATLEDEHGFLDCILQKRIYERFEEVFNSHPFLVVSGQVQRDANAVNLIVRHVEQLGHHAGELRMESRDFH